MFMSQIFNFLFRNLPFPFKVDENMKNAQSRNALHEKKFWFRNDIQNKENKEYSLMTVNEIINGKDVSFFLDQKGLVVCLSVTS